MITIQFTDVEPPMVTGCHEDIHVNATEQTLEYSWTEPKFSDSRGSALEIVSNYPTPEFTFPWGDFTVQYVATKISNGLRTECSFKIKVRRKYLYINSLDRVVRAHSFTLSVQNVKGHV
jgi:hypothetical protein